MQDDDYNGPRHVPVRHSFLVRLPNVSLTRISLTSALPSLVVSSSPIRLPLLGS